MESAMVKRTPAHTGRKAKHMAASGTALSDVAPCPYSHVPNATTLATIEAAERGEDMYGPFYSVADVMEALNADD